MRESELSHAYWKRDVDFPVLPDPWCRYDYLHPPQKLWAHIKRQHGNSSRVREQQQEGSFQAKYSHLIMHSSTCLVFVLLSAAMMVEAATPPFRRRFQDFRWRSTTQRVLQSVYISILWCILPPTQLKPTTQTAQRAVAGATIAWFVFIALCQAVPSLTRALGSRRWPHSDSRIQLLQRALSRRWGLRPEFFTAVGLHSCHQTTE